MKSLEPKVLNLAIGIPSGNTWEADFAISTINMIGHMRSTKIPGYHGISYVVLSRKSSLLPKSREDIVKKAIQEKADYLLFLDSDQAFEADLFNKMLAKGKSVVAANIALKSLPSFPTARKKVKGTPTGDFIYSNNKTGCEKVWRIGFGAMLINMTVFNFIPKPWFKVEWTEETGPVGEDWYFCEQLEKAGIDIYVDHDVSQTIGHLGGYEFTIKDIKSEAEQNTSSYGTISTGSQVQE